MWKRNRKEVEMRKDDMKGLPKGSGRSRGVRHKPLNGGGMRRGGGQGNNYFDSNGPGSVRVRGSASQLYERYTTLARESVQGGDRTYSEGLYQHAEHYLRIQNSRGGASTGASSSGGGRNRREGGVQPRGGGRGKGLGRTRFERDSYRGREEKEEDVRVKAEEVYVSDEREEEEDKQGLLDFLGGFDTK